MKWSPERDPNSLLYSVESSEEIHLSVYGHLLQLSIQGTGDCISLHTPWTPKESDWAVAALHRSKNCLGVGHALVREKRLEQRLPETEAGAWGAVWWVLSSPTTVIDAAELACSQVDSPLALLSKLISVVPKQMPVRMKYQRLSHRMARRTWVYAFASD